MTAKVAGEPATWWKVESRWRVHVEPVKVREFTDKSVTMVIDWGRGKTQDRRVMRASDGVRYFPVRADAIAHAREMAESKIASCQRSIDQYRAALAALED